MAKIHEEVLVIKISALLPDSAVMSPIMTDDNVQALQQVIKQLAGDNMVLVEIEKP